eukprot:455725-Pelagomonas_calceolata.AAC.1
MTVAKQGQETCYFLLQSSQQGTSFYCNQSSQQGTSGGGFAGRAAEERRRRRVRESRSMAANPPDPH